MAIELPPGVLRIAIRDNAMEPEVRAGTAALVEACDRVCAPGLYVFEADGEQVVRRVDVLLGGVLRLSAVGCDPAYLMPAPGENTYRNKDTGETARLEVVGRAMMYVAATG